MSAVDNLYNEMVNRWIRLKGTVNPNTDSSLDPFAIGTSYADVSGDPVQIFIKNRTGSNGWDDFFASATPPERIRYVDKNYIGGSSNGSQLHPYTDIQEAIEIVEDELLPTGSNPAAVVVLGGNFADPKIVIRKSGLNLVGFEFPTINASQTHPAITLTNATKESLEAYRTGGSSNYGLLVNQGNSGPGANIISGFIFSKSVGGPIDEHIVDCLGVAGDVTPTLTLFGNDVSAPAATTGITFNNCHFSNVNPGYFYCRNSANIKVNVHGIFLPISIFNSGLCNFQFEKNSNLSIDADVSDTYGRSLLSTSSNFVNGSTIDGTVTIDGDSKLVIERCSVYDIDASTISISGTLSCNNCTVNGDVDFGPAGYIYCLNLNVKGDLTTSFSGNAITLINGNIAGTISNTGERITWTGYGIDPPERERYVGPNSKGYSNGSKNLPFTDPQATIELVESTLSPTTLDPVTIYISGTVYDDPRMVIHKSGVNLEAIGSPTLSASLDYPALTLTNATQVSLDAYRAGGSSNYGLLVNQGDLGPGANVISGFTFAKSLAGTIDDHTVECLGVSGDISSTVTAFGIDSASLVYGGLHFRGCRGVEFNEGYFYARNARGIYIDLDGTFQPIKMFNCALCKFTGFTMESFVFDGDLNDVYGRSWSLVSRKNEMKNCNINLGCSISNYTWIEISNSRIANFGASSLTRSMLFDNCYIINNATIGSPDTLSCRALEIDGNLTVGDINNPSFKNVTVAGNLVISAGSNPLPFNGEILGSITDSSSRLIWTGQNVDPLDSVRYINPNFTGGYSNGYITLPFTTAELARADDPNALIKLTGFIEKTNIDTGTNIEIDTFADTVGNNSEWNMVISKGVNIQRLVVSTVWDSGTNAIASLSIDSSVSIGTIDITMHCDISSDIVRLLANATSDDWNIKISRRIIS